MYGIFDETYAEDYGERTRFLTGRGIALWDVFAGCRRKGSLDSAIKDGRYNDFTAFLASYPSIHTIFFNGRKAEGAFLRYLKTDPKAEGLLDGRKLRLLPSSSPVPTRTMRRMEDKMPAWRAVRDAAEDGSDG
jgi:hypoxanthine-DNA glycosylase